MGVFALTLSSYALAIIGASVLTARKQNWWALLALPLCFTTLHFAFGFGFIVGLVRFWNRWGDRVGRLNGRTMGKAKKYEFKSIFFCWSLVSWSFDSISLETAVCIGL
jgi:hypothetical protein